MMMRRSGQAKTLIYLYHSSAVQQTQMSLTCHNLVPNTFDSIQISLGKKISQQSFNQWLSLYQDTCRVICNPEEYTNQGRPDLLTQEDKDFMTELIDTDPGLLLDKICDQVHHRVVF
jgi:hypothetical protein